MLGVKQAMNVWDLHCQLSRLTMALASAIDTCTIILSCAYGCRRLIIDLSSNCGKLLGSSSDVITGPLVRQKKSRSNDIPYFGYAVRLAAGL